MEEYPEEGIPGHAAKTPWAHRLQRSLKELGVPFEAEGEATRVRLAEGVYAEVREASEGYTVAVSVPLPSGDAGDIQYYVEAFRAAVAFLAALGVEPEYEVDSSLPGYPMLRALARFSDPESLVDSVLRGVRAVLGG